VQEIAKLLLANQEKKSEKDEKDVKYSKISISILVPECNWII